MTQYLNEILTAKTRLSEEELDKLVTSLYLHKNKVTIKNIEGKVNERENDNN
jgi:hypothetical protein